jgi:hypothetical protein
MLFQQKILSSCEAFYTLYVSDSFFDIPEDFQLDFKVDCFGRLLLL